MYQIIHPGGIFRFPHRLAIIIILRDLMGPENVPPWWFRPTPLWLRPTTLLACAMTLYGAPCA